MSTVPWSILRNSISRHGWPLPPNWENPSLAQDFVATFGRRNPEIIRALFDPNADDVAVAEIGERKEVKYRSAAKAQGVSLLPGVGYLLEQLRVAGWIQAVGSSIRERIST